MNEAAIETAGLAPLRPHLESIAAIQNKTQLATALGESLRADVDALNNTNFHTAHLFGLWVAPDFNDPEHYTAYLLQGGLQLPDREYYLSDSDRMKDIRSKYQAHVSAMLKLAGFADTDARAERIVQLEHAMPKPISLWRKTTTSTKRIIPGSRPTSPPRHSDWTGPHISKVLDSANKPASSSGNRRPSRASRPFSLPLRLTLGETGSPTT